VVANFIVRVRCEPPVWVTYAPLLPLFLLLLSGLYLFALPYLQRASRSHAATDSYQERGGAMAATRPRSKDG
jgi:hypothetical protein